MVPSDAEIAVLVRQVRDNPRSVAFVALAEALRKHGRHTEALAALRDGERNRPDHTPARVVLARIHLDLGNHALALEVLDDVVRVDPENLAATALLARLLVEDGRIEEAAPLVERLRMSGGAEAELAHILDRQTRRVTEIPVGDDAFDCAALADRFAARSATGPALAIWTRIYTAHPEHPIVRRRLSEAQALHAGTPGPAAVSRVADLPEWPGPATSPRIARLRAYADHVLRYA